MTQGYDFKWRHELRCRWLLGTKNCVKAHVGDVITVQRWTHNNATGNMIWFPLTLTDIDVKFRNSDIPMTESRLRWRRRYNMFSTPIDRLHLVSAERQRNAFPCSFSKGLIIQRCLLHSWINHFFLRQTKTHSCSITSRYLYLKSMFVAIWLIYVFTIAFVTKMKPVRLFQCEVNLALFLCLSKIIHFKFK